MITNFDKKNPFIVPDGYFEDFASKMASMTNPFVPSLPWYKKTKSWIAIAAALSGIIIGTKLLLPVGVAPTNATAHQITVEESYILNQMDESALVKYVCNADDDAQSAK